jgi:hypothetical protein
VLAGAYLFGGVTLARFSAGLGVEIPSQYLSCSPICDDRRAGDHFPRRTVIR